MSFDSHTLVRRKPRLKSQYPRDSPDLHVEYVLVGLFDEKDGAIVEHQYPNAISGDKNMLGELMIPEGVHSRNEDWTIFFLHKDVEPDEEDPYAQGAVPYDDETEEYESEEEREAEGPPLMYCLSLVNTKLDASAGRGAVVRAMAICTRHPFLHIYKPILLLALDRYFKSPTIETLDALWDSLNDMDISLMPRLSILESRILQMSDVKNMFVEKFQRMIRERIEEDQITILRAGGDPNMVNTANYKIPRDTHDFTSKVLYDEMAIPVKVPTAPIPENVGDFSIIQLIQRFSIPHADSPQPFRLHPHLTTNGPMTHPMIVLINAILTQKRVLFLGHNKSAGEVAEAVLAACALASGGILRGFTRHAFPYTDLSKVEELTNVPGFIAGVTNPLFESSYQWWDLLCDLSTGRMKISPNIEPAPKAEGQLIFSQRKFSSGSSHHHGHHSDSMGDKAFMEDVLHSIASRHGEHIVRAKWRGYISKFTRIAAAYEEVVYGATALYILNPVEEAALAQGPVFSGQGDTEDPAILYGHGYVWPDETTKTKELAAWAWRVEGWRNTRSYYHFIQDAATMYHAHRPIQTLDLQHQHDRLSKLKLSRYESASIYVALYYSVKDYKSICQLLTVCLECRAGLNYIAAGMLHPDKRVREMTAVLIERIRDHEAGKHFYDLMSSFHKAAYKHVIEDRDPPRQRSDTFWSIHSDSSSRHK